MQAAEKVITGPAIKFSSTVCKENGVCDARTRVSCSCAAMGSTATCIRSRQRSQRERLPLPCPSSPLEKMWFIHLAQRHPSRRRVKAFPLRRRSAIPKYPRRRPRLPPSSMTAPVSVVLPRVVSPASLAGAAVGALPRAAEAADPVPGVAGGRACGGQHPVIPSRGSITTPPPLGCIQCRYGKERTVSGGRRSGGGTARRSGRPSCLRLKLCRRSRDRHGLREGHWSLRR